MIYVVRIALIALYTVIWGIPGILVGLVDRSGSFLVWVARNWVTWIFTTCGIHVRAEGLENLEPGQTYVYMANHQSLVDVGAIMLTLPVSWRFVAKRELARVPVFGWAMVVAGHVIVDRGKTERAVASMRRAAERVRAGTPVVIFPEGTRSHTGALGPFKSGGFHLALQAGVPILPVSISGSRPLTPKGTLRVESGHVKVVYGRPICTDSLAAAERKVLMERVRAAILEGLDPALQ